MAEEEGIEIEMTKEVRLKLKSTKMYDGIKIGVVSICETNDFDGGRAATIQTKH